MYTVDSDGEDFRRRQAGAPEPTWERKQPWLDSLRAEASEGKARSRVRILGDQLTEYERYACELGYALNAAAGRGGRGTLSCDAGTRPEWSHAVMLKAAPSSGGPSLRCAPMLAREGCPHVVKSTTLRSVNLRWTRARAEHIGTRSTRYPDVTDIEVEWADEAAADRRAVIMDPDPKSSTGAMRVVGYSPSAGFVLTVIVLEVDGEYWE